ncbi:hypothetical protein GQ457_17G013390 [Hibiscus cannabinus]
MSTQPQQQPAVVYPNNVPPSHSHSNGSFGPVFMVLAVIAVISAIACFIGRMCNRRRDQTRPSQKSQNQNHDFRPKERDVELGFDGRIPGAKLPGEDRKGFKTPGNEDHGEPSMAEQGGPIPRIRIPGNGDPRGRRVHANGDPTATGFRMPGPKPMPMAVGDGALKPDA